MSTPSTRATILITTFAGEVHATNAAGALVIALPFYAPASSVVNARSAAIIAANPTKLPRICTL